MIKRIRSILKINAFLSQRLLRILTRFYSTFLIPLEIVFAEATFHMIPRWHRNCPCNCLPRHRGRFNRHVGRWRQSPSDAAGYIPKLNVSSTTRTPRLPRRRSHGKRGNGRAQFPHGPPVRSQVRIFGGSSRFILCITTYHVLRRSAVRSLWWRIIFSKRTSIGQHCPQGCG